MGQVENRTSSKCEGECVGVEARKKKVRKTSEGRVINRGVVTLADKVKANSAALDQQQSG